MPGKTKSGFTLIELIVAIVIIALLATIAIPNLQRARPGYERKKFIGQLNALLSLGWQGALMTHKVHKVLFNFNDKVITLQAEGDEKDAKGEPIFKKVKSAVLNSSIPLPETLEIKNFFIEQFDEMTAFVEREAKEVWFFIVPEGLTQDVIINFLDTRDVVADGKPRMFGLVLNPFTAQFKLYDTFQKP